MTNYIIKNFGKIRDIVFLFFCITSFSSIIYLEPFSDIKDLMKLSRYISYILLLIVGIYLINLYKIGRKNDFKSLIINLYKYLKNHVLILITFLISFLVLIISKHSVPLILWVLGLSLKGSNKKRVLKIYFYSLAFLFILTLILNKCGIIPSVFAYRELEFSRDSLGFIYPLETQSVYLIIGFGLLYFTKIKYKYLLVLILNVFNYFIYLKTDSRFSFFLLILISLFYVCIRFFKLKENLWRKKAILKVLAVLLIVVCFIIFPLLCYFYSENNEILNFINSISSKRLYFAQQGFNSYGLSLFGKDIDWIGFGNKTYDDLTVIHDSYNFVDCSYVKDLLDYGFLYYVLMIFLYSYTLLQCIKSEDLNGLLLISLILILSLSEARLLQVAINPALIMVFKNININNRSILRFFYPRIRTKF